MKLLMYSWVLVSIQQSLATDIDECNHFIHTWSWRAYASKVVNNPENTGWCRDDKYNNSIFKVIASAIADGIQKKNYFSENSRSSEIIDFRIKPGNQFFSQAHKNALILYNFIAEALNDRLNTGLSDDKKVSEDCIEKVGAKISKYFTGIDVSRAVKDIKNYAKSLNLYEYLKYLRANRKRNNTYYKTVEVKKSISDNKVAEFTIKDALIDDHKAQIYEADINVIYENDNIYAFKLQNIRERHKDRRIINLFSPYINPCCYDAAKNYVKLSESLKMLCGVGMVYPSLGLFDVSKHKLLIGKNKHIITALAVLGASPYMRELIRSTPGHKKYWSGYRPWFISEHLNNMLCIINFEQIEQFIRDIECSLINFITWKYMDNYYNFDNRTRKPGLRTYLGKDFLDTEGEGDEDDYAKNILKRAKSDAINFINNIYENQNIGKIVQLLTESIMCELFENGNEIYSGVITAPSICLRRKEDGKYDKVDSQMTIEIKNNANTSIQDQLQYELTNGIRDYCNGRYVSRYQSTGLNLNEYDTTGQIWEFPDNAIVTVMQPPKAQEKNEVKCNTEITLQGINRLYSAFQDRDYFFRNKYRLVSVVTQNTKTGEIYTEIRGDNDMWIRTGSDTRYKFNEKDDNKFRLVAIYERIKE